MILYLFQSEPAKGREIRRSVDWESYGFTRLETAYSQEHADELLAGEQPDLIICGTDFPDGSCYAFLQKIHDHYPNVYFILTGMIRIEELHEVLSLGVLEYIEDISCESGWTKPIQAFLSAVSFRNTLVDNARKSSYWFKNRALVQDQFWKNLFLGKIGVDPEEIVRSAMEVEEHIDKDRPYLMTLITMKNQEEMWSRWGEHVCQSMLLNIGRCVSKELGCNNHMIIIYSRIIALFKDEDEAQLSAWFDQYSERAKKELGADLFCYLGEAVYCEAFPDLYYGLLAYSKDDVLRQVKFVKVTKRVLENQDRINIPPQWNDVLYSHDPMKLVEAVRAFLVEQAENGLLTEKKMRVFQQDILQLLFLYMEHKDLSAHQLYDNSEIYKLYKVAILSIDGMCWWIQSCIQYINDAVSGANHESGGKTIAEIKNYIRSHLSEKITMEQIASHVHLSPDYVGKYFKRDTGETVQSYLIRKRMEKARDLLQNTDRTISDICFETGYGNPSYFISVFRQYNGITPQQYRIRGK